ncbi:hypothetical protein ACIA6D_23365 [Streptomyces cacaoi]
MQTTGTPTPELVANPAMEATHYGIQVATLGEDGDMIALGHHDTRRALAAFNRHARVVWGLLNLEDSRSALAADWAKDIKPCMAVFRTADPESDYEDPGCIWFADWSDPDSPDARPVTILHA